MNTKHKKYSDMLFDYGTTYKTQYQPWEIKGDVKTVYKEKPTCLWPRPPPLKCIHTVTDWKTDPPPFSVPHKPKEIIRTSPHDVQEPYVKPPNTELDQIRKTRPRLVMTPAVSMDDIDNEETRKILLDDVYTSNMGRANKEVETQYFSVKAPMPNHPAPANPVTLPKLRPPYVEPEWRMESVKWDRQQLRSFCEPTTRFWTQYQHRMPCPACEQSKRATAQRKMLKAIGH